MVTFGGCCGDDDDAAHMLDPIKLALEISQRCAMRNVRAATVSSFRGSIVLTAVMVPVSSVVRHGESGAGRLSRPSSKSDFLLGLGWNR